MIVIEEAHWRSDCVEWPDLTAGAEKWADEMEPLIQGGLKLTVAEAADATFGKHEQNLDLKVELLKDDWPWGIDLRKWYEVSF